MLRSMALAAALAVAAVGAHAQTKKELVAKVLQLQQPALDNGVRAMVERPALALLQQAGAALQQAGTPDKREATFKDIQAEAKKFADEAVPLAQERARKLAPSTMGALLEERFSEDELKTLAAWLESPVNRKFAQATQEIDQAMGQKLNAEITPVLEPKLQALQASMRKKLQAAGVPMPAASAPAPAAAPKK